MNPIEEQTSLKQEPLPVTNDDRQIPTRIARIDSAIIIEREIIRKHEQQIIDMQLTRDALLKRAKEVAITQDSHYKIVETPVYKKNRVDVEALKLFAPDAHFNIMTKLTERAAERMKEDIKKAMIFIPQDMVKKEVTDKALLAKIIPVNTEIEGVTISIVPR